MKKEFSSIVGKYASSATAEKLWAEIVRHYTSKKRYYHNLLHLENMLAELEAVKDQISDWDATIMSLVYHDIIYKPTAKNNEEQSAALAKERLHLLSFPSDQSEKCEAMILATKSHTISTDHDTNLFTDADLSILGKPWLVYEEYVKNIRKEYSIYPDFLYNPGRKKVLQHFLSMPRIYKTESFFQLYEETAKTNLAKESKHL